MINVEQIGDSYLVSFKGNRSQFNHYINRIMSIDEKDYDFERKCWKFDKVSIERVYRLFEVVESKAKKPKVDIVSQSKTTAKPIKGYEDMGKSMKLSPYDYQKEAIKFGIDNKEALVVYPCGTGKVHIVQVVA